MVVPSSKYRIGQIEQLRKSLLNDHELVDTIDFKSNTTHRKTISSIAKTSASKAKFSAFLHLLINHLDAKSVLETGTSLGINTLYLAHSKAEKITTIEGSTILSELARKNFRKLAIDHISLKVGAVDELLVPTLIKSMPDFVFLDADHRGVVIEKHVDQILKNAPQTQCIIVHDIFWSKDMYQTWQKLIRDPRFNLTVDLFQAGILFPNKDMEKQHFTLRF